MKRASGIHWLIAVCVFAFPACAGRHKSFTLTLAHINDTHGHLAPSTLSFRSDNATVRTEAAGFPRLAAVLKNLRSTDEEMLFLHAGDVFQGTLYFKRFAGRADCNFLNSLELDAMAVGNHEFDRGPSVLADFAGQADFRLLSANIDVSRDPALRSLIKPFIIKKVHGKRLGIIGLSPPDTPQLSQPGDQVAFFDAEQGARKAVQELTSRGVRMIIVLSHLGYQQDLALASRLPEIDIIAGGHSHTLLGDFSAVGLESGGPYPTVCKNADNATVLVAQAWEWAKVVGTLSVSFDDAGAIQQWRGEPVMPVGTAFMTGAAGPVTKKELGKIRERLAGSPGITPIEENTAARALLEPYSRDVAALYRSKVTQAPADIAHARLPGPQHPSGSDLARLVADSMLWKARAAGLEADAAITNAGAVRGSLPAGEVTVGQVRDLLPFGDALVICRLRGRDIRQLLDSVLDRAVDNPESGSFPYAAGLRYTADFTKPPGRRILKLELRDKKGRWRAPQKNAWYRLVTNSYAAQGKGGYGLLAARAESRKNTGFEDAESFIEYAGRAPELKRLTDDNTIIWNRKK